MKDNMYFKITGWMIEMKYGLKLKINDLLLFAYMYQFKNKETYVVNIYMDYLGKNLPITQKQAMRSLQVLLDKKIIKEYGGQFDKKNNNVYTVGSFLINKNRIGKYERKIDTSNVKVKEIDIKKFF